MTIPAPVAEAAVNRPLEPKARRFFSDRNGQSLIESVIVVMVACFIFMGLFQLSQLFASHEFLNYSAARGVRARAVGFNDFMVWKTARLGAIPNAGKMISPEYNPPVPAWSTDTPADLWNAWLYGMQSATYSPQFAIERSRMPLYLGADWLGQLPPILDYEDWDTLEIGDPVLNSMAGTVSMTVRQFVPLRVPLHQMFITGDSVELSSHEITMENHSQIYLE